MNRMRSLVLTLTLIGTGYGQVSNPLNPYPGDADLPNFNMRAFSVLGSESDSVPNTTSRSGRTSGERQTDQRLLERNNNVKSLSPTIYAKSKKTGKIADVGFVIHGNV